jgi:hypothetical protein
MVDVSSQQKEEESGPRVARQGGRAASGGPVTQNQRTFEAATPAGEPLR